MVKKAHLITGKGGVGKSLFSVVLAHYFSTQNQNILLSELSEHSFFKDYLNLPQISYTPINWKPGLDISQWSPDDCLKEYCLYLLKIESLYKLFFENPVSKSLIQVAPGLNELALLGKLTSSPREQGPPMKYDQIVVDAFATGHFLSLLRAPGALSDAVPFGPLGEQAKAIDACIRNPEFTEVHIVTLAEELPITESIELFNKLKMEFNIKARVYLNKVSMLNKSDLSGLSSVAAASFIDILESEERSRAELNAAEIRFMELPLVPTLDVQVMIDKLTSCLRAAEC